MAQSAAAPSLASQPESAKLEPLRPLTGAGPASKQPPNHYRTIISNSRIHILENASLVIRDLSQQDQGYYLCQAANNFGSLSALIKLTVNGRCRLEHQAGVGGGAAFSPRCLMMIHLI